ncbi:MAG TPA: DUF4214 domain-containing protein [Pirellulales bacterium]|nr:DUF4214 domain-containing protein [Pirellulales bacterium]
MVGISMRRMRHRRPHTFVEPLEARWLLSAAALESVAHSNVVLRAAASGTVQGLSPQEVQHAYGFDQIQFSGLTGDGSGQTIAIVDPYDDPNIADDLAVFDAQFGLAAPPSFSKVFAAGSEPRSDAGWSEEIALDVEWAHAIAPGANIVLVEARTDNLDDLLAAVNVAKNLSGVSVVSMSWGGSEFSAETSDDALFTTPLGHPSVTFVAAAGDQGAGTIWPSVSPNVLTVGGTTLDLTDGNYGGETAWTDGGGGASRFENEPLYQQGVQSTGARTSPDVAYDGDPNTGFAVYDSEPVTGSRQGGWIEVGGTSAGTPQWAALIAIANEGLSLAGEAPLSDAPAVLYQLPSADFHDIVNGSDGNQATTGYDLATGLGSPVANLLVASLVGNSAAGSTNGTSGGSSPGTTSTGNSGTTNGGGGTGIGVPAALGSVASALTHDSEYAASFVTHAYQTLLDRDPDSAGLAWWTGQMQAGATDAQVEAALLGSAEYVQLHGGTDTGWIDAIYSDLLDRPADLAGAAYWLGQLETGVGFYQIALSIADTAEHEAVVVANDYFTYLGRTASPSEIAYWVAQSQQGTTDEEIITAFISSAEYFDNPNKGSGTTLGWLDSVFQDLFQRAPTPGEQAYWLGLL